MHDPAEQPFLDEIIANPADVMPRLIFADWLEERGDPRAEFIRVQCELAEMTAEDERWEELRRRESELFNHARALTRVNLPVSAKYPCYHRGFVERVVMCAADFLELRQALFAVAPIRHLYLKDAAGVMRHVARCEELLSIVTLELNRGNIGDGGFEQLASSPNLRNLETLNLCYNQLTDFAIRSLADSPNLGRLRNLNLSGNGDVGNRGLAALAQSHYATQIRELRLNRCHLQDRGVVEFTQSANAQFVEVLEVEWSYLSDSSLIGIATSPTLTNLKSLAISASRYNEDAITHAGVWALAGSENARKLRRLKITGDVCDEGLQAIAEAACFDSLVELCLEDNDIGDNGLIALAESPRLAQLEYLDLRFTRSTFFGVEQLMRSAYRTPKLRVRFHSDLITKEDQRELHQLFGKSALVF